MNTEMHLVVFEAIGALLVVAVVVLVMRRAPAAGQSTEMTALLALFEKQAKLAPQHSDLSAVYERLSVVERSVAELSGLVTGVKEMVARTERFVGALVQNAIDNDKKGHE